MDENKQTIDSIIPDWRERIDKFRNCFYLTDEAELLSILKQLVLDRNEEGIREFYNKVCTYGYEWNDREKVIYDIVEVFCNMRYCDYVAIHEEPKTKNNYLCFKCVYHRGMSDEFSMFRFIKKDRQNLNEASYKSFLVWNNMVGMETFLHAYEFDQPVFEEKHMVQCNNLVLSFKIEGTDKENEILYPKSYLDCKCLDYIKGALADLNMGVHNIFTNGEDLTVVVDLWRSVTLKSGTLRYILSKVEEELRIRLKDYHIYDNEHFFMVPGSINSRKPIAIERKSAMVFQNKDIKKEGYVEFKNSGYVRCYYRVDAFFYSKAVSLTTLAELLGYPKKEKKTKQHIENYKRFYKVGKERLKDLDELIALRGNNLSERFNLFRIMANILFYLNYEPAEVLAYINDKNNNLSNPISEACLLRIYTFCFEDYEKYLQDSSQGIKYTNRKIFELLHIKDGEQTHMKQLINQDEAEKRAHESHLNTMRQSYAPVKAKNQAKKDVIIKELLDMRRHGMSNKQIADSKGWYVKKVTRLIGKEVKSSELEEQVEKYANEGKAASEISNILDISISKVYRIKKKLAN